MSRSDRVTTGRWPDPRCALLALGGVLTLCPLPAAAQSTPVAHDMFGYSVAAGDFNGDGIDDLAVGIVGKDLGGSTENGAVEVHYGVTGTGPMPTQWLDEQMLSQSNLAPSEQFGYALAAGDFNADGRDDLAIGVPREQLGVTPSGVAAAYGAVYVVFGKTGVGLNEAQPVQSINQNTVGIIEGGPSVPLNAFLTGFEGRLLTE